MNRRDFIAAISATLPMLSLASAGQAQTATALQRIDAYLLAMRSAQGTFVQYNADGSQSGGSYWLKKPGFMKFEYARPHPHVIIADGTWVAVVDRSSNDEPNRYPIGSTPLNILLRDDVQLATSSAVQNVDITPSRITVSAVDPDDSSTGTLEMVFDENPFRLRQWVTINPQGQRTTIQIQTMEQNIDLPRRMFSIETAVIQR